MRRGDGVGWLISGLVVLTMVLGTVSASAQGATLRLEIVVGEGMQIPVGEWRNFQVRVVDVATGAPVPGARVAWQTPALGSRIYVGVTDGAGVTSATQLYTSGAPGSFEQTATLVSPAYTGGEWSDLPIALLGTPLRIHYTQGAARTLRIEIVSGGGMVIGLGAWQSFVVRVLDEAGAPVSGVRVAWQTPALGPRVYVGVTDASGTASATQLYSSATPGSFEETVAIVAASYAGGEWSDAPVPTIGAVLRIPYSQR